MIGGSHFLRSVVVLISCFLHSQAVTVTPVTVSETSGLVTFTATPTIAVPNTPWFVQVHTEDDTAVAGTDYISTSTTIVSNGPTIDVTIVDNSVYVGDRTFIFNFTFGGNINDALPHIVVITIVEDEDPPVELEQPRNITIYENVGDLNITITREDTTNRTFQLVAHPGGGDATEGDDFELVSTTIDFAEGENEQILQLRIIDDLDMEDKEFICIWLNSTDLEVSYVFYIFIKDNDTPLNYHCGRGLSQPCLNGGICDYRTGACSCPMMFKGDNCGIDSGDITTDCSPECVNGTCVLGQCVCDPGFAGETCDRSAYYHECTSSGFSLCITPFSHDTFNGIIAVYGFSDFPECVLELATPPLDPDFIDGCLGFVAIIPYNSTCGELGPLDENNSTLFRLKLSVQYTANISRYTDEKVTLTCVLNDGVLVADPRIVTNAYNNYPQSGESEFAPALLTLTDPSGFPLPAELLFGSEVRYCVSVADVPAFSAVTIDRIIVDNARNGGYFRQLLIYDEGCFPNPGVILSGPVWVPSGDNHTMCFTLEVFVFSIDAQLQSPKFRVTIILTVGENSADVTVHVCGTGRRRRRAVGDDAVEKLEATVTLINPDANNAASLGSTSNKSSCATWIVPTFIGLGVFTIVLAIIVIVLTIAVARRHKERKM